MMLENVRNYYEKLVLEELKKRDLPAQKGQDYVEDVACVALNNLPTQYIRFEVDMGFYMEGEDHYLMHKQVQEAVDEAIAFIKNRQSDH